MRTPNQSRCVSSRRNKVDAGSLTPVNATAPTATYLDRKLDSFFRKFGIQGGLWFNVRRAIMSDGAEIASGALGHGAVAVLPDLAYLEWSFKYGQSSRMSERNNTDAFLEACEKLHNMFQRFVSVSSGYDDGTSEIFRHYESKYMVHVGSLIQIVVMPMPSAKDGE